MQDDEDDDYDYADIVQCLESEFVTKKSETAGEFPERSYQSEQSVDDYHDDPELSRPHTGICKLEFFLQMGIDADIDGHQQVKNQRKHSYFDVHQSRQTDSDENHHFVDGVDGVIEVVAIDRPLSLAHSGESAVQRVSVPIDDKAQ